jgi:hypothetical protein
MSDAVCGEDRHGNPRLDWPDAAIAFFLPEAFATKSKRSKNAVAHDEGFATLELVGENAD